MTSETGISSAGTTDWLRATQGIVIRAYVPALSHAGGLISASPEEGGQPVLPKTPARRSRSGERRARPLVSS